MTFVVFLLQAGDFGAKRIVGKLAKRQIERVPSQECDGASGCRCCLCRDDDCELGLFWARHSRRTTTALASFGKKVSLVKQCWHYWHMTNSAKGQGQMTPPPIESTVRTPPLSAAVFDLADDAERFICDAIRRMHTGRWPLFRAYRMRRVGSLVYEVAEWLPRGRNRNTPVFSMVTWDIREAGLRWHDYPTLAAARDAFDLVASGAQASEVAPPGSRCSGLAGG